MQLRLSGPARQRGFSLIEAMVSIVVLAFGVLALAGLQLRALADSVGASHQNVALQLAGGMADRIRANHIGGSAADNPYVVGWEAARAVAPYSCAAVGAACTSAQMAAHDQWIWKRRAAAELPGGAASVQSRAQQGGLLFVHVAWDEPAVVHPIAPDGAWECPAGKACLEVVVALPQP